MMQGKGKEGKEREKDRGEEGRLAVCAARKAAASSRKHRQRRSEELKAKA